MMLFGAKLELEKLIPVDSPVQRWSGVTDRGVVVWCTFDDSALARSQHSVGIGWRDGSIVHGFGPTFDAAKRDCVRMLSERSREVGRV